MDDVGAIIGGLIGLVIVVIMIAALWKTFVKAGHPGWAAIVPFYNLYILTQIAGKPGWWVILMLIPYIGIIWSIWTYNLVAKNFGKSSGFTVGLVLLPFIFWPILGFGDAQYQGIAGPDTNQDVLDSEFAS
jgi:uncharacterized membrane protein YhaH (DUF805 family)